MGKLPDLGQSSAKVLLADNILELCGEFKVMRTLTTEDFCVHIGENVLALNGPYGLGSGPGSELYSW